MNQIVIQQALDNLYNEGVLNINEKSRISKMSVEKALEIEAIRDEAKKVNENNQSLDSLISNTEKSKPKTELDLLKEILNNLKSINSSNDNIKNSNNNIKGWVTFMGVLLIIQIVSAVIIAIILN